MAETGQLDQLFNTTADSVAANANEVALLNPATDDVFGPYIALEVRKGDTIRFSVNAQYLDATNTNLCILRKSV